MNNRAPMLTSLDRALGMSCGDITPAAVQAAADLDPSIGEKIEAVMVLARCLKGADGKALFMTMPPALALAIIRVLEDPNPLDKASKTLMARR